MKILIGFFTTFFISVILFIGLTVLLMLVSLCGSVLTGHDLIREVIRPTINKVLNL